MSAAALARRSTLKSSSCAATAPPKSFEGSPPTLTRSEAVLLYWLGVSKRACSTGACCIEQSRGIPPVVVPLVVVLLVVVPPVVLPDPTPDPDPVDVPGEPLPSGPPICPSHPATEMRATSAVERTLLVRDAVPPGLVVLISIISSLSSSAGDEERVTERATRRRRTRRWRELRALG